MLLSLILSTLNPAFPSRCQTPHHHFLEARVQAHGLGSANRTFTRDTWMQWGITGDQSLGEPGSKGVPFLGVAAGRTSSIQFSIPSYQMVFTGYFNSKQLGIVAQLYGLIYEPSEDSGRYLIPFNRTPFFFHYSEWILLFALKNFDHCTCVMCFLI